MNTLAPTRRYDLDWVRLLAFGLLIPYHVGMYYVTWDWHVKSPLASSQFEPFMVLSAPWRLILLFFISGVASKFLQTKSKSSFLRRRSVRLLIPLIFGMLVIVPPQSYYEVVKDLGFDKGYLAFWWQYLSGHGGFCDQDGCLDVPTWNHLWFVAYLWVYTLLLPAAGWLARKIRWPTITGLGLLLWPAVFFICARLLLLERFESTHGLDDDWYNHVQYFSVFLFGYFMAQNSAFWMALQRLRWISFTCALFSAGFLFWYFSQFTDSSPAPDSVRLFQRVVWGSQQWMVIAALLGFAHKHWQHNNAVLRYLSPTVFPLYILHQSVIVVLAANLQRFALPVAFEAPLLIVATLGICLASYELIRRVSWLRLLLGLKRF